MTSLNNILPKIGGYWTTNENGKAHIDGSIFKNREGRLPGRSTGYYREYVIPTPGAAGPGPQRIVTGLNGEIYYSPDHYQTFLQVQ